MDERQRESVAIGLRSAQALVRLLDDVEQFALAEGALLHFERKRFDLLNTVDDCVQLLSPLAQHKKLHLAMDVAMDVPQFVLGDAVRVRQVLYNLVSNAIKFTDEGSVDIFVSLLSAESDEQSRLSKRPTNSLKIRFVVVDTGRGMSESVLKQHLFRPFLQSHGSADADTLEQRVSGVGLALCNALVEGMGGRLSVESKQGAGTTFECELRFGSVAPSAEERARDEARRALLQKSSISIVSANSMTCGAISRALEHYGASVATFSLALEAVDAARAGALRHRAPDLFVVDTDLPLQGAATLVRGLRETSALADARIVLLIAEETNRGETQLLPRVDALHVKPVRRTPLLRVIERELGRATARSDAPARSADAPGATASDSQPAPPADPQRRSTESTVVMSQSIDDAARLRILVADDDFVSSVALRRMLLRLCPSLEVTVVSDGAEAALVLESAPDAAADATLPKRSSHSNVVPAPCLLSTLRRPPMPSTSALQRARPTPLTRCSSVSASALPCDCKNGRNKCCFSTLSDIPRPVSTTTKRILREFVGRFDKRLCSSLSALNSDTNMSTEPSSVNLIALLTKL